MPPENEVFVADKEYEGDKLCWSKGSLPVSLSVTYVICEKTLLFTFQRNFLKNDT